MYKIVGNLFDEEINRECATPDYAIGVFMAQVQNHELTGDMWLELRKE